MRAIAFLADIAMGLIVGLIVYAATTAVLPDVGGGVALGVVLAGCVLLVAMRRPGGSLRAAGQLPARAPSSTAWSLDRVAHSDVSTWTVPRFVISLLFAWLVSAVILAVAIPVLHAVGVDIDRWIVWPVILLTMAVCVGPELWRAVRGGP